MTHCFAASSSPAGKCLISAATKCDAKCSATFPNGESVTTPIFNVLVMISHKSKMACHCAEALPAWKGSGLDDETCESSPFFNVGINRFRELHKVALFKLRLLRLSCMGETEGRPQRAKMKQAGRDTVDKDLDNISYETLARDGS